MAGIDVPQFVDDIIDDVIARYLPALMALDHGDRGHRITWVDDDTAECSCGQRWESTKR